MRPICCRSSRSTHTLSRSRRAICHRGTGSGIASAIDAQFRAAILKLFILDQPAPDDKAIKLLEPGADGFAGGRRRPPGGCSAQAAYEMSGIGRAFCPIML